MTYTITFDHVALIVHNPSRTATLLENIFDVKAVRRRDNDGHDEVFLRVGGTWLVLVAAEVERPLTGDHIAFHATAEQLQVIAGKLKRMGHAYQMARSDTALYFNDFDNHVFEVNSTGMEAELGDAT